MKSEKQFAVIAALLLSFLLCNGCSQPEVGTQEWLVGKWSMRIVAIREAHWYKILRERHEKGLESPSSRREFEKAYPYPLAYVAEFYSDGTVKFTATSTSTGSLMSVEDGQFIVRDGTLYCEQFDMSSFVGKAKLDRDRLSARMRDMSDDSFRLEIDYSEISSETSTFKSRVWFERM